MGLELELKEPDRLPARVVAHLVRIGVRVRVRVRVRARVTLTLALPLTLARYVDIDPDDPHNVLWPKLLELVC